jgi:hypothetical protein
MSISYIPVGERLDLGKWKQTREAERHNKAIELG